MSTRCCVEIKRYDFSVVLYHHHDGYPSGVGQDLLEKLTPQIDSDVFVNRLVKDPEEEYEITLWIHSDIEYYYIIDFTQKNPRVLCYEARWDENGLKFGKKINLYKKD